MTITKIIGWLTEEMASELRAQGVHLRFVGFSAHGIPVHEVRP
ncbi:hypothetical protein [Aquitalea aquatilis]|nr:hypothetical protein [Aquitalea aquatilis]